MSFVPLLWIYTQPATRRPTSLQTLLDVPVVIVNPSDIVHCGMAGRSHWGNIFPVFQLDPGLQYFSLLSKSVWDQQEHHGGSFYHLLRSYFYRDDERWLRGSLR